MKVVSTDMGVVLGDVEVMDDLDDYYEENRDSLYETIFEMEHVLAGRLGNPRLTIELVPESSWFSNVRDHATTNQWDTLRRATYKRYGNICAICKGRGPKWPVECHEAWKYVIHEERNVQKLHYLVALCPSCHEVKHIGLAELTGNGLRARKHLSLVNKWNREQTELYVNCVATIWRARSELEWELDLGWVESHFGFRLKKEC